MASSEGKRVLAVLERDEGGGVLPASLELIRAGSGLAEEMGAELSVAVLGHGIQGLAEEMAQFSAEVFAVDHPLLSDFKAELSREALHQLCRPSPPDVILFTHSLEALEVAPKLACRLGGQLVTDCVKLEPGPGGELLCDKPIYGDNAVATFVLRSRPAVLTLRSKVLEPAEPKGEKGRVVAFEPALDRSVAKTEVLERIAGEEVGLDKAEAIVAGGRGIRVKEGLGLLEELIQVLRDRFSTVELGASRPLVDMGWLPPSRQLGLTGERASPQLYIAVGISGASQHLSGVLGSKKIIAINKDPEAPIFKVADYGVVGEYEKVPPGLIRKLRELR